jgi:hypothetical protein
MYTLSIGNNKHVYSMLKIGTQKWAKTLFGDPCHKV